MAKKKNKNKKKSWNVELPKIKVLAYCDSPTCATGFGTVSRNIFEGLYNTGRYQIDVLGINYWGDPHNFPYRIWPTGTNQERDPYGRKKVCNMIPQMEYDILFFLQDTFILDFLPELIPYLKQNKKKFKSICYYPIDGEPKEKWIKNISVVDYPVAYSQFGKDMSKKMCPDCPDMDIIPHGVNVVDYFPLPQEQIDEFRTRYFGPNADKFIFMNLNRNQQRKDIPRTIQAFAEFRKQVPDSLLYLHMAQKDQGWDLVEVCKAFGFNTSSDIVFPSNFGPNQGYPRKVVNMLYNSVDCVLSTTLGEGWGLSWSEAMAAKKPIIMPRNTALAEAISEDKGYLVNSGTNPSLFTVLPHDNEVIRPLVDVDDLVAKMLEVHNDYEAAMQKAENAYNWVTTELAWGAKGPIVNRWIKVFDEAYRAYVEESSAPEPQFHQEEVKKEIESEQI
jgi:glycosyltransferase involved in cell wall biosynthesis